LDALRKSRVDDPAIGPAMDPYMETGSLPARRSTTNEKTELAVDRLWCTFRKGDSRNEGRLEPEWGPNKKTHKKNWKKSLEKKGRHRNRPG